MKKLSELSNDTMLSVCDEAMTKEDFMDSAYFLDYPIEPFPSVYVADVEILKINLLNDIEHLGEEAYEGWAEFIESELMELPETIAFVQKMEEVMAKYPICYEGEAVEVDIFPTRK